MNISTNLQWSFQFQKDGLAKEDFPRLDTQSSNFCFSHLYNLSRATSSYLQQPGDEAVHVQLPVRHLVGTRLSSPQREQGLGGGGGGSAFSPTESRGVPTPAGSNSPWARSYTNHIIP